jgi:hypothetical protein
VDFSAGTASVSGAATSDTIMGITAAEASGNSDTLIAGSGADTLSASGANSTLAAGSGADTLIDSGSSGSYQFAAGDGQATIVNGSPTNAASSNELDFGSGITDGQLWFQQSGNDLQIDVLGTTSEVTVSGWFSSIGNQLQEITAGGLKLDSQVSQLVQAMATYAANDPGFNPTTATAMPNDPNLQNAIAVAWHS